MSTEPFSAAAWIARRHGRLAALRTGGLVVKIGGSIQDNERSLAAIAADVAALVSLGAQPVLVHGGGKAITAAMAKAGLPARFVQGQRYTDEATMKIVEDVLIGTVNRQIVDLLTDAGVRAEGLHTRGAEVLFGRRAGTDAAPGKPSEDLGLVGRVDRVDAAVVLGLCAGGVVPVIAPVALEHDPRMNRLGRLNVNADLAAGTIAAQLGAARFVLLSDTPGVRTDPAKGDEHAAELSRGEFERLMASGVIAGGMLPKLAACFEALAGGTREVAIADGRVPHGLLATVLAEPGEAIPGTRVVG